jgi:hypothetical protein
VLALVKLAHIYECQTLLDRCEKHLMNCVEIPMMELLYWADLYGLNKLQVNLFTLEKNLIHIKLKYNLESAGEF